MPYAPSVNDRSGEILGDAMTTAAQTRLAGTQAIAEGVQSAGSSIAGALSQFDQVMAKNRANMGSMEALKTLGPSVGMTQEELDSLAAIKDPDKLSGALSMYGTIIDQRMKENYLTKQLEANTELAARKAQFQQSVNETKPRPPGSTFIPTVTFGTGIDFSK